MGLALMLLHAASAVAGCSAQHGFERGHAGVPAPADCVEVADHREAWRLGRELATLETEQRALEARIADAAAEDAGNDGREARNRLARRSRQLGVDIEAIRGALTVRGIVMEGPTRRDDS